MCQSTELIKIKLLQKYLIQYVTRKDGFMHEFTHQDWEQWKIVEQVLLKACLSWRFFTLGAPVSTLGLASAWAMGAMTQLPSGHPRGSSLKLQMEKGAVSITGFKHSHSTTTFPSCKHPLLFWRIYSREQQNAFRFTRCRLFQDTG